MKKNAVHIDSFRNHLLVITVLLLSNFSAAQSFQEENKKLNRETNELLREAEEQLEEEDFSSAEASYRKAVAKNSENVTARYNMANMYYGKEKPEHAIKRYNQAAKLEESKEVKHKIYHNMGNSFMEQKDYAQAVEAYKHALRNVPSDEQTRYNLALAKKKLEEEEPEGGGDDDQDQEQDDQNEDQQDEGDQDEGDQDQDQEGGENENKGGDQNDDPEQQPEEEKENGDPKDKQEQEGDQGGEEEQQPQQPQPGQLSPQQIQSLLEAMNNEEKKVQDKINAEKAKGAKTRTGKDW